MFISKVRRFISFALLASVIFLSVGNCIAGTDEDSGGSRKVKSKVSPTFPELARKMHISGVVKVELVVAPSGAVKSAKVIGGHPVLVEPALDAAKKWRFEPGNDETTTTVSFNFNADHD